jgi:hypothetical protein
MPTATPTPMPTATPTPHPTPTPTPSPTSTPSGANVYHGCRVLAATDLYYQAVNLSPADPNSATILANYPNVSIDSGVGFTGGKAIIEWNLANNGTGMFSTGGQMYNAAAMPWQAGFWIETCCSDHHGYALNTQTCGDYEGYQVFFPPFTIAAGHFWDLTSSLSSQYASPEHSHGAEAADMPQLAGAYLSDRDCCGVPITHAGEWIGLTGFSVCTSCAADWGYVRPADSSIGPVPNGCAAGGCAPTHMVYGDRLRLHASFSLACSCPQAQAIVTALKTYGTFFSDGGSTVGFRFGNGADGSNDWNASDLANLTQIHMTDFDVVSRSISGGLICPPGHSGC